MKFSIKAEYVDCDNVKKTTVQEVGASTEQEAKQIVSDYLIYDCWVDKKNIICIKVVEPEIEETYDYEMMLHNDNLADLYNFLEDWSNQNKYEYHIMQHSDKIQITLNKEK